MNELLTYEQVRTMFGWKSNKPIQRAIKAGTLKRVFLTQSSKTARITSASAASFLNNAAEEKAALQQFGISAGQWASLKQARAREDAFPATVRQPRKPMPPITETDPRKRADLEFARKFLAGEATDSLGNDCHGKNPFSESGPVSLLGPMEPVQRVKFDSTAHMDQALVYREPMIGTDGQPVVHAGSLNHPLNKDFVGIPTPTKAEHPNAFRNRALHVTIESWLDGQRHGYSR